MASNLLRLPNPPPSSLHIRPRKLLDGKYTKRCLPRQRICRIRRHCSTPGFFVSNSIEISTPSFESTESSVESAKPITSDTPILLDVSGMMCGGCVARVKSVLMSDDRVGSAVVNMLTETAAVRLKPEVEVMVDAAESLARRLTESGFEAKKRVSGMGVSENVKKWKEMVSKKEELLVKSRNRVAFAWTLVALCCGSHTSHILHSLGIHIAHGGFWDLLHNSYVKGGLAVGALLGPGRGLLLNFPFPILNAFQLMHNKLSIWYYKINDEVVILRLFFRLRCVKASDNRIVIPWSIFCKYSLRIRAFTL